MGLKVMSISSLPVFATPTLGLAQYTTLQVVQGLLGEPSFFWVLNGDSQG